jgi:phosphoglycolate phosphatase
MKRLILFDVDGTIIRRGDPNHLGAMDYGIHTVFPDAACATIYNVDFDGKVDRLIATEVLAQAGIDMSADDPALTEVFNHAGDYYRKRWAEQTDGSKDLLPGVAELVAVLSRDEGFALGVMTGGSRNIVAVKLERLGLAGEFPIGSFGHEVSDRPALVPLALKRAQSHYNEAFPPERVVIVGDTPADVHCAHVHNIPCVGVATGKFSEQELLDTGADAVFEDLSDVTAVLEALRTVSLPVR